MAMGAIPHLGNCLNKWSFRASSFQKLRTQTLKAYQQTRGFKRVAKRPNNENPGYIEPKSIAETGPQQNTQRLSVSRLWKPLVFTVAFTGTTFSVAAVAEHERLKQHVKWLFEEKQRYNKAGELRQKINDVWNSMAHGQKIYVVICTLNALVFLAWRIPRCHPILKEYFSATPASNSRCSAMLFSMFSHQSGLHIVLNMYVLNSFTSWAVPALGPEQFVALYLSAGVFANLLSYAYKIAINSSIPSIGASGAITGIFGYVASQFPEARFHIVLLPQFQFVASSALKGFMLMETTAMALRLQFFDHAAHLGGTIFGVFWQGWGKPMLWPLRIHLLQLWESYHGNSGKP